MDLRGIGISSIGGVPSERVDVLGVVPKVSPWAGMRRPVGDARQVKVMASVTFRKFNRFETQH
jgi:hypothetical protein